MNKIGFVLVSAVLTASCFKTVAMPNPWTDCGEDLACGAKTAGFDFPLRVKNRTVRAMRDMMEIRFPLDEKRVAIVRKSAMPDGRADENGIIDISGDYNNYPVNRTVTIDNGVKFAVRGDENNYKVASFAAETGYYGILCGEGLSLDDIRRLYDLLAGAEAPKPAEND